MTSLELMDLLDQHNPELIIALLLDLRDKKGLSSFAGWQPSNQRGYVRARMAGYGHEAAYLYTCYSSPLRAARSVLEKYGAPQQVSAQGQFDNE